MFLRKYREGVERFVPRYKIKKNKMEWYNARCAEAKKKEKTWRKMRKQWSEMNREEYRTTTN